MILIGQYDSPFVRRVAIAMRLYGMPFEHRPWSVFGDAEKIAERTKEYEDRFLSPFVAAERGYIDEVISPNSTRKRIARALALLRHKELENPWKKHDNIPL